MNAAEALEGTFRGKSVFLTGHTGFKGSWLTFWLRQLGAKVTGFSHDIPTSPSMFQALGLEREVQHIVGDVRDLPALERAIALAEPDFVFHLAAQSLVRPSHKDPVETFATNVLGTVHLLEAVRRVQKRVTLINVTSDKCYENRDWPFAYRETDALGGADPYSASKGCAEIVFASYQRSFFAHGQVLAGSVRAGNVIGGGDFALDRLIPDCMRAWSEGKEVVLRNPEAVRPWQHVLEPLGGYLWLARKLSVSEVPPGEGWNFGPASEAFQSVGQVVEGLAVHFPGAHASRMPRESVAQQPHEARTLKLSIDKAADALGWRPTLSLAESLELTAAWYHAFFAGSADLRALTAQQIETFSTRLLR